MIGCYGSITCNKLFTNFGYRMMIRAAGNFILDAVEPYFAGGSEITRTQFNAGMKDESLPAFAHDQEIINPAQPAPGFIFVQGSLYQLAFLDLL